MDHLLELVAWLEFGRALDHHHGRVVTQAPADVCDEVVADVVQQCFGTAAGPLGDAFGERVEGPSSSSKVNASRVQPVLGRSMPSGGRGGGRAEGPGE
jgi:hypothetical protein